MVGAIWLDGCFVGCVRVPGLAVGGREPSVGAIPDGTAAQQLVWVTMGDYGWSMDFDTPQGIDAVEYGRVLEYPIFFYLDIKLQTEFKQRKAMAPYGEPPPPDF